MDATLIMFRADGSRREFAIKAKRRYLIGRNESCDLQIPVSDVSREHAAIYFDDDQDLVIEDLGSSNGTYVNNERVEKEDLCPGDVVVIGAVPFRVVINGQPKNVKPVRMSAAATKELEARLGAVAADAKTVASKNGAGSSAATAAIRSGSAGADGDDANADAIDLIDADLAETPKKGSGPLPMPDQSDSFFAFDLDDDD